MMAEGRTAAPSTLTIRGTETRRNKAGPVKYLREYTAAYASSVLLFITAGIYIIMLLQPSMAISVLAWLCVSTRQETH